MGAQPSYQILSKSVHPCRIYGHKRANFVPQTGTLIFIWSIGSPENVTRGKRYFFQTLPYMSPKRQKNISDLKGVSHSHLDDISSRIIMYFGVSCYNWLPVLRECKFFKQNIAYLLQLEMLNRMVYSKSNLDLPIKNKSRKTKKLGFYLIIKGGPLAFWSRNNFCLVCSKFDASCSQYTQLSRIVTNSPQYK